jgi:molybdopterin-containing oxidoreductase family iron-sulfur binding subunit
MSYRNMSILTDVTKCIGCEKCVEACREQNDLPPDKPWRWLQDITDLSTSRWTTIERVESDVGDRFARRQCKHCLEPACVEACIVGALKKTPEGPVIYDRDICIGCRYCMIACPYNARFFNFKESEEWPNKEFPKRSHGVAEACTLCAHLLEQGRQPACAAACQGAGAGAITVGDLNDPESGVSKLIAANAVKRIREDLGTEPKVHYIGL